MKGKYLYLIASLIVLLTLSSCSDDETYADQKKKERQQIADFISDNKIQVIAMDEFLKDTITNNPFTGPDSSKNEYVLINETGVYLQIERKGTGKSILDGERRDYTARYFEYNISSADTTTSNLYESDPEILSVSRSGDTYSSYFLSGIMSSNYGSSVPKAWLAAFPYITPGFLNGTPSAKIRIIVPHSQGTQTASLNVNPFFYEIIINSQKWQ